MGASATPARICPECGTRNSGLSLFCAECGASLTNAETEGPNGNQTTTTFTPVADPPSSDPYTTQQFRPQSSTDMGTAVHGAPVDQAWTAPAFSGSYDDNGDDIGHRGMILGWIAVILILLVIGFFAWASLLDQGTRDSITGLFS